VLGPYVAISSVNRLRLARLYSRRTIVLIEITTLGTANGAHPEASDSSQDRRSHEISASLTSAHGLAGSNPTVWRVAGARTPRWMERCVLQESADETWTGLTRQRPACAPWEASDSGLSNARHASQPAQRQALRARAARG